MPWSTITAYIHATIWPLIYLVGAVAVSTLAALTKDYVKHWLGLTLLWSWTISNYCVWNWGFDGAATYLAIGELALTTVAAGIGYSNRSVLALIIVLLFGCQEAVQVLFHFVARQGTWWYYASLNVIFALQLLTVGGASAAPAFRRLGNGGFGIVPRLRHWARVVHQ